MLLVRRRRRRIGCGTRALRSGTRGHDSAHEHSQRGVVSALGQQGAVRNRSGSGEITAQLNMARAAKPRKTRSTLPTLRFMAGEASSGAKGFEETLVADVFLRCTAKAASVITSGHDSCGASCAIARGGGRRVVGEPRVCVQRPAPARASAAACATRVQRHAADDVLAADVDPAGGVPPRCASGRPMHWDVCAQRRDARAGRLLLLGVRRHPGAVRAGWPAGAAWHARPAAGVFAAWLLAAGALSGCGNAAGCAGAPGWGRRTLRRGYWLG